MNGEAALVDWEGWRLTPEGAAVHESEGVAVVADVHLGYEWARGAGGDMVPAHSLRETLARLESLRERLLFRQLVVAGDLIESPRPCRRTAADLRGLRGWLEERGIALRTLRGNHDPAMGPPTTEVGGWTIGHGDRPLPLRSLLGHHHPALRCAGLTAPCFVADPGFIVLPAFSANAAGLDVTGPGWPSALRTRLSRCVAALDGCVLDFGLLTDLARARLVAGRSSRR